CFFFFQAEDGIRDRNVTGVQTCALPISMSSARELTKSSTSVPCASSFRASPPNERLPVAVSCQSGWLWGVIPLSAKIWKIAALQIGRASCRERVALWVGGVLVSEKQQST